MLAPDPVGGTTEAASAGENLFTSGVIKCMLPVGEGVEVSWAAGEGEGVLASTVGVLPRTEDVISKARVDPFDNEESLFLLECPDAACLLLLLLSPVAVAALLCLDKTSPNSTARSLA